MNCQPKAKNLGDVEGEKMKKKILECPIHGLSLHRCKRKVWHTSSGKEDKHPDAYTERCFKCISEGRYAGTSAIRKKKNKHVSLR